MDAFRMTPTITWPAMQQRSSHLADGAAIIGFATKEWQLLATEGTLVRDADGVWLVGGTGQRQPLTTFDGGIVRRTEERHRVVLGQALAQREAGRSGNALGVALARDELKHVVQRWIAEDR